MRLRRFEIEDFGLIARASLEFSDGFTVCTGETGSGKTMLLGALGFALGERASADRVRAGATRARVTLEIEPDAAFVERLREADLDDDGESTIFARELNAAGKSTARVNGRLVTSTQVRELGAFVVESIGQHEQQRLLSRAYQQDLLDAYAGDGAIAARGRLTAAYARVRSLQAQVHEREANAGRVIAELEFARYALGEIETAAPFDREDETLRERRDYLANGERIAAALAQAHAALAGDDGAATEALGSAASTLGAIARFTPELANLQATVAALQSDATEVATGIARALERAEFDPVELEAVTARLDALERIKKKYGGSLAAVFASRDGFARTIEAETTRDDRDAELRAELATVRVELDAAARALSIARGEAAGMLEGVVAAELADLAMPSARFSIVLDALDTIGPSGAESVEFALSPNPGEPVRSLARAASGGELSRVLLALVTAVAGRRERTALVFDEIDAGIGGATASAVGVRLGALARRGQVLCVTHLAQIATWADRHYALRKREQDGGTIVELVALDERATSLEEIARMLSGSSAGVALEHAEALVREVRTRKRRSRTTPAPR